MSGDRASEEGLDGRGVGSHAFPVPVGIQIDDQTGTLGQITQSRYRFVTREHRSDLLLI